MIRLVVGILDTANYSSSRRAAIRQDGELPQGRQEVQRSRAPCRKAAAAAQPEVYQMWEGPTLTWRLPC